MKPIGYISHIAVNSLKKGRKTPCLIYSKPVGIHIIPLYPETKDDSK